MEIDNGIICLDAGHGGIDHGASFHGLKEKDITLDIVLSASRILSMHGYTIVLTRSDDRYVPLYDRCRISNDSNADMFISIHCNADPDQDEPGMPEAKGEEIWYFTGSIKGHRIAQAMKNLIDTIFEDEPFRGIKETNNFYVLKYSDAPAVLIEVGFIDNSKTNESLRSPITINKIGNIIARGIMEAT